MKIDPETYDAYRNLFSTVFSDYHLFKRLYGVDYSDAERVQELLLKLELQDKTHVENGEFSTVDLSGGQRKRVALMVSLLEDKPLYIFDEWAADQDPQFRRKFYREILPEMKRAGKTVIAVTHDDQYFDVADRRPAHGRGSLRPTRAMIALQRENHSTSAMFGPACLSLAKVERRSSNVGDHCLRSQMRSKAVDLEPSGNLFMIAFFEYHVLVWRGGCDSERRSEA